MSPCTRTLSCRASGMQASPIRRLVPLADAAKKRGIQVYHLNIGQPDISTPTEIMDAIRGYSERVLAYGPSQGLLSLQVAIQAYYAELGIDLATNEVLVTTAGSEALLFALMAIGDPGDEILIPEPFYTNYNGFATMAAMRVVPVPMHVEDGFALPPREAFEQRITSRTRAILYCSPNNPTGTVLQGSQLEMLADVCRERNLWLLGDEVYREFMYDGSTPASALQLPGMNDRVIVVDSISKRFSACGARIGCLISRNPELIAAGLRFGQARLCPPTLEQVAAVAGYHAIHKYLPDMIGEYRLRRDLVCEELSRIPGTVFEKPAGAFYIMPRLPLDNANRFAEWMLNEFSADGHTTMIAPGDGFYATPGSGMQEIRIAYVLKEDDLRHAMKTLALGVDAYQRTCM